MQCDRTPSYWVDKRDLRGTPMSSSLMTVEFPDGRVRFGLYNGTSDIGLPWLRDTQDEAWRLRNPLERPGYGLPDKGAVEAVRVTIHYGSGTRGWMLARGGHLIEHATYVTQPVGYRDEGPSMKLIENGPFANDRMDGVA